MPLGSPNVELYRLGRGKVYAAKFSGGSAGAYVDLGNCPVFNVEVTVEKLAHYSSQSDLRSKDKEVVIEAGYKLGFDLDEIGQNNLAIFLMGTIDGKTIHALKSLTDEYAIKFESDNPAGPDQKWWFHRCTISPSGAHNLIDEEWGRLPYTAEGLKDTTNNPTSEYFDVDYVTTTTTTSTTTTTTAP